MSQPFPFEIPGRDGWPIQGFVHLPEGEGPRPVALLLHGFKGFKSWGFLPYLAESLRAAGMCAIRFDLSACGMGPDGRFAFPDRFRRGTLTRGLDDLDRVVNAVFERTLEGSRRFAIYDLALVGFSTGGSLALLHAARDTRIKSACVWAPVADFGDLFPADLRAAWRRQGYWDFEDERLGHTVRLGPEFLDDVDGHDVLEAAASLDIPYLVLHASGDTRVPPRHGERIFYANHTRARLQVLPGADHRFGITHPMRDPSPALETAAGATVDFLRETLGEQG